MESIKTLRVLWMAALTVLLIMSGAGCATQDDGVGSAAGALKGGIPAHGDAGLGPMNDDGDEDSDEDSDEDTDGGLDESSESEESVSEESESEESVSEESESEESVSEESESEESVSEESESDPDEGVDGV